MNVISRPQGKSEVVTTTPGEELTAPEEVTLRQRQVSEFLRMYILTTCVNGNHDRIKYWKEHWIGMRKTSGLILAEILPILSASFPLI